MAFNADNLYPIGPHGGNNRLWIYNSTDAIATVNTSGYFNNASAKLTVRDVILVLDTSAPTTSWVNVLSNSSGVVDVSDGTAIVETDTD